jgi:long-chain fatty acid transport protein
MNKTACVLLLLLCIGAVAFASDNQSAAWVRSLCREAVTDSIDAAYFNPAGTAFLEKGLHIQAMNLSVLQEYSHTSVISVPPGKVYSADTPVWLFPTARIGYSSGSWTVFFDFNIPAGGGSLDYDEGAVYVDSARLAADAGITGGSFAGQSSTFAFSLGGAYQIGSMVSVGASARLLYGTETFEGTLVSTTVGPASFDGSVTAEASGIGFGGMVGVNFLPFPGLTIAVTLETMSKLELEYTSVSSANTNLIGFVSNPPLGIVEGGTKDADLPWRIRTGIAYETPFGLTLSSTFKYAFYEALDDAFRNTYTIAGSLAYDITDRIEVSAAGSYGIDEIPDVENYDPLNPELSSFTIAGGFGIEVIDGLVIDASSLYVLYEEDSASGANGFTDLDKNVLLFGVGVTYSFN